MENASQFFKPDEIAAIREAIMAAELKTSGQVRVFIESHCGEEVIKHAAGVFEILELHKTAARNGVLFYLAVKDRKFAILGDSGIHQKVPEGFWENIKQDMQTCFRENRFTEGMVDGIGQAGEKLQEYFPHLKEGINEIPDDIVFGA
jgi:uncharacterized membrane protein